MTIVSRFTVGDRVRFKDRIGGIATVIGLDLLHVRLHWDDDQKTYARAEHLELYYPPMDDSRCYLEAVT